MLATTNYARNDASIMYTSLVIV